MDHEAVRAQHQRLFPRGRGDALVDRRSRRVHCFVLRSHIHRHGGQGLSRRAGGDGDLHRQRHRVRLQLLLVRADVAADARGHRHAGRAPALRARQRAVLHLDSDSAGHLLRRHLAQRAGRFRRGGVQHERSPDNYPHGLCRDRHGASRRNVERHGWRFCANAGAHTGQHCCGSFVAARGGRRARFFPEDADQLLSLGRDVEFQSRWAVGFCDAATEIRLDQQHAGFVAISLSERFDTCPQSRAARCDSTHDRADLVVHPANGGENRLSAYRADVSADEKSARGVILRHRAHHDARGNGWIASQRDLRRDDERDGRRIKQERRLFREEFLSAHPAPTPASVDCFLSESLRHCCWALSSSSADCYSHPGKEQTSSSR